jgi:hypothetical protein
MGNLARKLNYHVTTCTQLYKHWLSITYTKQHVVCVNEYRAGYWSIEDVEADDASQKSEDMFQNSQSEIQTCLKVCTTKFIKGVKYLSV